MVFFQPARRTPRVGEVVGLNGAVIVCGCHCVRGVLLLAVYAAWKIT
jgi:hypothetical protein